MQFENDVVINKPLNEVFAYLMDVERLPEWNYAISRTAKITAGAPKIGTKYRQERTLPQPMVEELEITDLKANELIELSGGFGPFPFGVSRYELRALSPTSTLLHNQIALKAEGAMRLLGPIATPKLRTAVGQNLQVLRSNLETTSVR